MTTKTIELPEDVFNELVQYAKAHEMNEVEALRDALEKARSEDMPPEDEELDDDEIADLRQALHHFKHGEPIPAEDLKQSELIMMPRVL